MWLISKHSIRDIDYLNVRINNKSDGDEADVGQTGGGGERRR